MGKIEFLLRKKIATFNNEAPYQEYLNYFSIFHDTKVKKLMKIRDNLTISSLNKIFCL